MLLNCGVGEDSESPWTARWSNQSILKESSPGCSLEGLMLKLKLQYFGHLMRSVDSLEKTLMLGGIGGRRSRGRPRMRWLHGITDSMDVSLRDSSSWWWTGRPWVLRFMGLQRVGHDWVTEMNWTELNTNVYTHQQDIRVSFSLPPCKHLLYLDFFMIAILTGVRWYLLWFLFTFLWWLWMLSIFSCTC